MVLEEQSTRREDSGIRAAWLPKAPEDTGVFVQAIGVSAQLLACTRVSAAATASTIFG